MGKGNDMLGRVEPSVNVRVKRDARDKPKLFRKLPARSGRPRVADESVL